MSEKESAVVSALARRGGLARARTLTPKERSEIARKAAQARWDRVERSQHTVVHQLTQDTEAPDFMRQVDLDIEAQIWERVRNHKVSATCPCDQCVPAVLKEVERKYRALLAKVDAKQRLSKEENLFFRLLTGAKADRWTRAYREQCKSRRANT